MARGQNAQRKTAELWKRWKDSVGCYTATSSNKKMCRRIMRHVAKQKLRTGE